MNGKSSDSRIQINSQYLIDGNEFIEFLKLQICCLDYIIDDFTVYDCYKPKSQM